MRTFPGHLTSTQSARKSAAKLVLYVVRTGNRPPRQEGNSSSQYDSARFGVCCFSNHFVHADWSTRPTSNALEKGRSMPGRCSSPGRCLTLTGNLKLTLLSHRWSLQLFTTIRRCHQQSAPALLLEKLSFHEHQHGTRGRQQGDFRPFQPASLAGRFSFMNRAPLLWNMLPRDVQTSSSMLVFKKKVLSLPS